MALPFQLPVLFLVFNRPAVTQRVFEAIRAARPAYLYVAADGPRLHRPQEAARCQEVRRIATAVDWDCQVKTLFREQNLGCKAAVAGAIDWFFEQVSEGIILEDDCLPTSGFFGYCQELLERYRHDTRITHINGNNFNAPALVQTDYCYHFTYFPQVWGWATWRRAWQRYDVSMALLSAFDDPLYYKHAGLSEPEYEALRKKWNKVRNGQTDTWDYQWHFINLLEASLAISPTKNLVANLGFAGEATHTTHSDPLKENLPVYELRFPLRHPPCLFIDWKLNTHYKRMMVREPIHEKIKRKLRNIPFNF